MTRTLARWAALAGAFALLLAACSGGGSGGDDAGGAASARGGAEYDTAESSGDDAGGGGEVAAAAEDAPPAVDLTVAAEGRQVISTATIHLRVEDLDDAVTTASDLAIGFGGLVFAEETDLRDQARTQLTLKVPPEHFRDLLTGLADLGEVDTQTVSTDDVTEQVVDLDSRIRTSEASVLRLRALLDQATTVRDITQVERELLDRETNLETLRGERRTIERQIDLATVTVTLRAQRSIPPPPPDEGQTGFVQGLRGGAHALKVTAVAGSAVAGALLPWLPLLLVALLVTRRWWWPRRHAASANA